MSTETNTMNGAHSSFSFVTMVENLVAGEHLEKNPWTADAMWHNVANQAVDALVVHEVLDRVDANIITRVTDLTDLPGLIGCPTASPIWRAIYTAYRLAGGTAFGETKYEIRNITARRAVTNKQFAFMLGVLVDRDVRGAKSRKEQGSRKPSSLSTARNAFGDGGFLTDAVAGKYWTPVYKTPTDLLEMALSGDANARTTLMIGGGFALIMDGYLTRDRESKVFEGTTPYRGSPPIILADLASHPHGLHMLATAWAKWKPNQPAHEYDIPDIAEDGSFIVEGQTLETRKPRRLTEGRLFEIANPKRATAGFLAQQAARRAGQRPSNPGDRDRDNRDRLAKALDIALDAVTELRASKVPPPPDPFGGYDEWKHAKNIAHEVYEVLVRSEPDPHATFIASDAPDGEADDEADDDI